MNARCADPLDPRLGALVAPRPAHFVEAARPQRPALETDAALAAPRRRCTAREFETLAIKLAGLLADHDPPQAPHAREGRGNHPLDVAAPENALSSPPRPRA